MSMGNSLLAALIVMSITFSCLIALYFLVKVESFIFSIIEKKDELLTNKETGTKDRLVI